MDSKVLYEKDGMRFTKISDKNYNLQFVIENKNIIMASDMAKMKNNAIICNIGHFDNEIDMVGIAKIPGIQK